MHTHLLNEHFELQSESGNSPLYFLELFEMSGQILEHDTMMQCFVYERNFSSLIVCFDLSNSKTISNLADTINKGIQALLQSYPSSNGDIRISKPKQDILSSVPVLVVGCKVDLVDDNR